MPVKRSLLLLVIIFLTLLPAQVALGELVTRVVDGDTIELANGIKVRYIGVDTPETVHPTKPVEFMGKEASNFNRKLVEGKEVRLEYDVERTDKYGRTLAYVFLDTLFVNAELIRAGYAQILTIPPNVKYSDLFLELQQQAREAGIGLWNEVAASTYQSAAPSTDPTKYYLTKSGEKYHKGGCKYLSKSAIEVSRTDAESRGYGPCSVCLPQASPSTDSSQYYVTRTGSKYHRGGCRYLAKSAIPIILEDARSGGYGACSVCIGSSVGSSSRSPSSSGRCLATTKKGTQCKRNAKAGSSYCWQHGG